MDTIGIYIHIPFCTHQCPFCAFSTVQYSKSLMIDYMVALKKELKSYLDLQILKNRRLHSIYLGGGTPSLVSPEHLTEVLDLCRGLFEASDDLEISLEATPESINARKAQALLHAGVNRLSLGAQSFSDNELKLLERNHTAIQTRQAFSTARDAGFANINLDLIYGPPNQSLEQWKYTMEEALALQPEHISTYGLTLEEGTIFYESKEAGRFSLPDEVQQSGMYLLAQRLLQSSGFEQYEISNFAKPGYPCSHNLSYWSDGEYLGLGASAHSHLGGRRFSNCFDPQEYVYRISRNASAVVETEHLTPEKKAREAIALGLRRTAGLNLKDILDRYHVQLPRTFYKTLEDLQSHGLISVFSGCLKLTSKGILLADELAATVMSC
jgi:oxygen-independent coproporphyrinogen-3 oxidase